MKEEIDDLAISDMLKFSKVLWHKNKIIGLPWSLNMARILYYI